MKVVGFLAVSLTCLCLGAVSKDVRQELVPTGLSAEKRNRNGGYEPFYHDCLVHGYRFRHGQVFSIPGYSDCLRYRCNRGGWSIYSEACEMDRRCHRVGATYRNRDNCRTYRCEKEDRGSHNFYQMRAVRTMCQDAQGYCRREGESFSKTINGRYYTRCQCLISQSGHIRYSCGSK